MDKARNEKKKYLFTVDILIEGYNNGIALESLLHLLNQDKVLDYDILKGISLGESIPASLGPGAKEIPIPQKDAAGKGAAKPERVKAKEAAAGQEGGATAKAPKAVHAAKAESATPAAGSTRSSAGPDLIRLVENSKESNALVRLTILKGQGIRLSLPCRILNFDPDMDSLTVYHVDEKKVYQFRMAEVEDFTT